MISVLRWALYYVLLVTLLKDLKVGSDHTTVILVLDIRIDL